MRSASDRAVVRRQALARQLFVQAAARLGILDWHDGRDVWVDLLSANAPLSEAERARLVSAGQNFASRCLVVAVAALDVLEAGLLDGEVTKVTREAGAPLEVIHALMDGKHWSADTLQDIAEVLTSAGLRIREPNEGEARYECPGCGSSEVELCFPVWVRANEMDNRELWDLDAEASPEKDSDKGWCIECQTNVLVRVKPEGGRR